MEVSEQIEVLETLLKIKNDDSINNFQTVQSVGSEMNGLSSKILALPTEEARLLLSVYINKIIKLRQDVEKSKRNQMELENQLSRQTQIVQNLEQSLDQSQIDKELRLSRLHKVIHLYMYCTYMYTCIKIKESTTSLIIHVHVHIDHN